MVIFLRTGEEFLRGGQDVADVDGLRDLLDVLMHAVAGADERDAFASGVEPGFEVGFLVADHERVREVDAEVFRGAEEEARLRLAAVAVDRIFRDNALLVVKTVVGGVDLHALFSEEFVHAGFDGAQIGFGEIAAGDAGLVGDHYHEASGVVHGADGVGREGAKAHLGRVMDVVGLLDDDAVAVKKTSLSHDGKSAVIWEKRNRFLNSS